MLIESSFCGPKPIPTPSLDMAEEKICLSSKVTMIYGPLKGLFINSGVVLMNNLSTDPFLSQDGAERDLVAEINAKTKLPITKQVERL